MTFFKNILGRIPWEASLKGKGSKQNWLILKNNFFKAQEQSFPMFSLARVAEDWHGKIHKYTEKGSIQAMEVRMSYAGGLQSQHPGMQGWN